MTLVPLPAFADNYIWMLQRGPDAIVVDPGDAAPVFGALSRHNLGLAAILVTHHHADHTGGVASLREATGAPVYGPVGEPIPGPYVALTQGDRVEALGLRFEVLDVPGHTAGHIAYFLRDPGDDGKAPAVFCGDTLFSGGCGRLFEGTAAQMLCSLDALSVLPGETRVCCAHEYTLSNLRFAQTVEPDNAELRAYTAQCRVRRERGEPTLPSHMVIERHINPFLRSRETSVKRAVQSHCQLAADASDTEVFAALRQWKNEFR